VMICKAFKSTEVVIPWFQFEPFKCCGDADFGYDGSLIEPMNSSVPVLLSRIAQKNG
jgi:hypothetical protein